MSEAAQSRMWEGIKRQDLGEIVAAVLEDGADVNTPDDEHDGFTPIHCLAYYKIDLGTLQVLVSLGLNVRARSQDGDTGIHLFPFAVDVLVWLLAETDAIEDINTLNEFKRTPLHYTHNCPGRACVLIAFGARTDVHGAASPVLNHVFRLSGSRKPDWLALFQVSARVPRRVLTSWLVDGRDHVGVDGSDRETFGNQGRCPYPSPLPVVDVASRLVEAWPLHRCLVLHGLVVATGRRDGSDVQPPLRSMN